MYTDPGFDAVGDEVFGDLVIARVVEPTCLFDLDRVLAELGLTPVHRNTFSASLRRAGQRGYRDQIAAARFDDAAAWGDVSLCLYDVNHAVRRGREGGPRRGRKDRAAEGRL